MVSKIEISNILKIHKHDFNIDSVKKQFTYPNPRFFENARLGFSNFATPRDICLVQDSGNDYITLPRGLIRELAMNNPNIQIFDNTITNPVQFDSSNIILRDYQLEPVNQALRSNQGVIVSPPGSGKTVMGIEIIVKRGQRSLILVHTRDLLNQWIERINKFTNTSTGIINSDHFSVKDITVGMVQSLNKPLEENFVKQFGTVLADECHHLPARTFQNLINQFPARFRIGLTATPTRIDGLSFLLFAIMGRKLCEIKRKQLFLNGSILKPKIKVIHSNFYLPDCRDYGQLLNKIIKDDERNRLIINYIKNEAFKGHYCLVLSERIAHIKKLYKKFSTLCPKINSAFITSKTNKTQRSQAIQAMNKGTINVLFATKLAEEGLDAPRLNRLFFCCPIRSTNKVKQATGRILRTFPGKSEPVVFDFLDSLCSLAQSQYYTRKKGAYAGYDIEEIEYNKEKDFGDTDSKETA